MKRWARWETPTRSKYAGGNSDVIAALTAEEANLLYARQLARRHGWWDPITSTMKGLRVLYHHTGRRAEWALLVAEIAPEFVDPQTDGRLPGRDEDWSLVTEYRVRMAREMRDWSEAERLQRVLVDWDRRRAEDVVHLLWNGADGSWSEPATFLDGLKVVAARLSDADRNTIRTLAATLHQRGQIRRECQQETCVAAYEEALALYEQIGNRPGAAITAFNLGTAYKDIPAIRGLPQAERWYRRSLELLGERDRLGRGKCLGQLGYVAFERFQEARSAGRPKAELVGHLNTALGFYRRTLDLLPDNPVNDLAAGSPANPEPVARPQFPRRPALAKGGSFPQVRETSAEPDLAPERREERQDVPPGGHFSAMPACRADGWPAQRRSKGNLCLPDCRRFRWWTHRVERAIVNSGFMRPQDRIVINQAPAELPKQAASFDLLITLGMLAGSGQLESELFERYDVVGELSLEGLTRPVKGALSMAISAAAQQGLRGIVMPAESAAEAAVVEDIEVIPVASLAQAVGFFSGALEIEPTPSRLAKPRKRSTKEQSPISIR